MSGEKYRILCAGNGSVLNRGCEAITIGTTEIIHQTIGDPQIVFVEFNDKQPALNPAPNITHHPIQIHRFSRAWFVQHCMRFLRLKKTWFPVLGRYLDDVDVVLALGGDNYSMDYGSLRVHLALLDYVQAKDKPFVIFGGSVGPFNKRGADYEKFVAGKLAGVALILAREDVTVEYLARLGITDNVHRVADPAFVMQPTKPREELIPFRLPVDAIGFNFSPLMARYVTNGDLPACVDLIVESIQNILKTFDRPVLLVPHVHKPNSDDYRLLERVYTAFVTRGDPVYLLPRHLNAAEVKWVISKLACFSGSRMHSTIASLSSAVPTLSFSYSIKSIGLNRDMFGHNEYMLAPQDITPSAITEKLGVLLRDGKDIRHQLESRLPVMMDLAFKAGSYLETVLQAGE